MRQLKWLSSCAEYRNGACAVNEALAQRTGLHSSRQIRVTENFVGVRAKPDGVSAKPDCVLAKPEFDFGSVFMASNNDRRLHNRFASAEDRALRGRNPSAG
jgi:hypothetical protein